MDALPSAIDRERHDETRALPAIQEQEAKWWRDATVLYFQTFSKRPITDECGSAREHAEALYVHQPALRSR